MWRLRQSNKIKEAILALHCSMSAFQQPIAENKYNDPLTAYFRRVSCPILQLTTIVSTIQSATNQGELFNVSPACSKFLFCGFSTTAKVKIPTKIIQIPTTIMTCLFIFKLSLNLEFYKTNANYLITPNMNVNFNLFLFQCIGSRLFELTRHRPDWFGDTPLASYLSRRDAPWMYFIFRQLFADQTS